MDLAPSEDFFGDASALVTTPTPTSTSTSTSTPISEATEHHGQETGEGIVGRDSDIDFLNDPPAPRAPIHVLAARLTAESPRLGTHPFDLVETNTIK